MDLKTGLEIGAAGVAVVGAFYGFLFFIDSRIKSKIRDEGFIKDLAKIFRPSVIFDHNQSILVDQGAMNYIESIEVELDDEPPFTKRIIVHPYKHLTYAPLLILLEPDGAEIVASRGKKHDWVYTTNFFMTSSERKSIRFRLEIIH